MQLHKKLSPKLKAYLKWLTNRDCNTTYGQFGEDAYLLSYFTGKTWKKDENSALPCSGFYVDIGAYSPTECSNSFAFYERGWSGINIDATPGVMESFNLVRRRDKNLNYAVGESAGELILYSWGVPNVFNTADKKLAIERSELLAENPKIVKVKCMRLDELLDKHMPNGVEIDFMSVDVEGMDLEVLRSNNWKKYRPELVVAEVYASNLVDLEKSELFSFMVGKGYSCIAWLQPSVIFKNQEF